MSPLITYVLLFFMALYALAIVWELIASRAVKWFAWQAVGLLAVVVVLNLATGFPAPRQAFGGASPIVTIAIMLVCTVLGIAANYFFYLKGRFSWQSFLKPVFVSPIVLLPLIGSVQGLPQVESIQLVSFAFIAFQNGFFWRVVLEHAKKKS